jgi:hypothetical protein
MRGLPGDRRAQRRVEREQLEQDCRARARRAEHEDRRGDRLAQDRGPLGPGAREAQLGLQHAQHLRPREQAPEQVQLRLALERTHERAIRGLPVRVPEVVQPGRGARERDQLVRVERDEVARVAHRGSEQVEPANPLGMDELLQQARLRLRSAR